MDEQKLKDIEAPKKDGGLTIKQKRLNTYIFTAVSSILNLFFMVALVFLLIFWAVRSIAPKMTQEEFSKWVTPIVWFSVIVGISFSLFIQKYVIRFVIKIFKLENKFEQTFVEKYCGKK